MQVRPLHAAWLCAAALALVAPTAMAQEVTPPEVERSPVAELPAGSDGRDTALVRVLIDENGAVSEATMVEPIDAATDAAVLAAARRWTFRPARKGDEPVAARIIIRVALKAPPTAPTNDATAKREKSAGGDETADANAGEEPADEDPSGPSDVTDEPADARPLQVLVKGKRRQPPPEAASDFRVDPGQLRLVPRRNAEQMLTLAPGFHFQNHGGEGHPSSIFLRGFNAGEGQDIRFEVDGVVINEPSNAHGHGYADSHFIIPELVRSLRVVEGPFDPRQGDFAVAGSVEYELGMEDRGIVLQGGYGSYNRRRLLALWGPGGTTERTFAGFDLNGGDGFGPNRAFNSARFMGQYELELGSDVSLLVAGTGYTAAFDGAGVLREDDLSAARLSECDRDYDSQFFCFVDPNQGGTSQRYSLNLRLEVDTTKYKLRQALFGVIRKSRLRENFTGFVTDVLAEGPQRGDGIAQATNTNVFGAVGSYQQHLDFWERRHELELGYVVRHDDGEANQQRVRFSGGAPYAFDFDNELALTNIGGYVAGKLFALPWLVLRGGARIDAFTFSVVDNNRPDTDREGARLSEQTIEAFGWAVTPRASLQVIPVPSLSVMASYGQGTRSSDAAALSEGELAPFARVHAFELGLLHDYGERKRVKLESRVLGYLTKVDRDLVFDPNAGRNLFIGGSNRFGALASSRMRTGSGVDTQLSVTYAEAFIPPQDAGFFDLGSGVRLPFVPRWVVRLDASLLRDFKLLGERFTYGLASGITYVAPLPLPLEQFGEEVATMDVSGRLRWRFVEAALEITNLFDRRNRSVQLNYPSNFVSPEAPASQLAARHYAAGAPFQAFGKLTFYIETPLEKDDEAPPI